MIAPVSAAGTVCFYVYGTAHLIADVSGYFPTGPGFTALTPARVLDTRDGAKVGNAAGTGTPLTLDIAGKGGLPTSGIGAVALNVTVTQGEDPNIGGGFVTVYPCGTRPEASNLNFTAGQTIPNSVIAPVSADGDRVLLRLRHRPPHRRRLRLRPDRARVHRADPGTCARHSWRCQGRQRSRHRHTR